MKEKESLPKDDVRIQIDDSIYELPDQPNLELVDGLLDTFGVEANDLLDQKFVTKQEEADDVLEQIKDYYNFDDIKNVFDDDIVHESVDFFYGGVSENFV